MMVAAELYDRTFTLVRRPLEHSPPGATRNAAASNARQVALDLIGAVLRRKRPLDDAIEDHPVIGDLSVRDAPLPGCSSPPCCAGSGRSTR
jgi:hypothetical protein